MSIGIHIFRRDLRIHDNVALNLLSKEVDKILPIFIFDPFQIDNTSENASYRSDPCVQIMIESLEDLDNELRENKSKLHYYYDEPYKVIEKLIKVVKPTYISYNSDFSKYSLKRDKLIDDVIYENKVNLIKYDDDNCLNKMELYLNKNKIFKVFGVFYKHAIKIDVRDEVKKPKNLIKKNITFEFKGDIHKFINNERKLHVKGGRQEALKIINNMSKYKDYENERDQLTYNTTFLSTYLKFGNLSIVEVHNAMKKYKLTPLIRQLYWRQFFFILARYNSQFNNHYGHTDKFFQNIKWRNDAKEAKLLWTGNTGFPIIDAGVRQLLQTGYMHNRLRLYVSNFAIKILQQDPFDKPWGGQYIFSKLLIDSCYANNYGNWNNTLGPYDLPGYRFGRAGTSGGRVYDPRDYKRWDPKLEFIRKYLPELEGIPDRDIFNWYKAHKKYDNIKYKPMIDFEERKDEWYNITKK